MRDEQVLTSTSKWRGRYVILAFNFTLVLGIYYCVDLPSGLQADLQGKQGNCSNNESSTNTSNHGNESSMCCEECLGLGPDRYNQLYSIISWTNAVLVFPAGVFVDKVGNRVSSMLTTGSATCGAVLFALSTFEGIKGTSFMFIFMMIGRLLLATGNGPGRVVQDRVLAVWFPDKLALAFGLIVTGLRLGNVLNFFFTPNVAAWYSLSWSLWLGAMFCGTCFIASVGLSVMDWYGSKRLTSNIKSEESTEKKNPEKARLKDIKSFPLSFWLVSLMIATYYCFLVPYVANGSKFLQDKYHYDKRTSSYINGALYDVVLLLCPIVGQLLDRFGYRAITATCGTMLSIPMLMLILWTDVSPILVNVLLGICYTMPVIALWPCIAIILPLKVVGTGNGLASFMLHAALGITSFCVGKILGSEEEEDENRRREKWEYMFMVLIGHLTLCSVSGIVLNIVDRRNGSKLNRPRLARKRDGDAVESDTSSERDPLLQQDKNTSIQ